MPPELSYPARRLRVLVVGNGTLDCASRSCVIALRAMGHEATYFDPDEHPALLAPLRRNWEAKRYVNHVVAFAGRYGRIYERALVRKARDFAPDLVLVIDLPVVSPAILAEIKRATGAVFAGWYQDAVVNFGPHAFLLADYDGLFFKDPYIVDRLRGWGGYSNVHLLPEACEPSVHHPVPLTADERAKHACELLVYGNLYPYRCHLLERVLDYDLRIYGASPPASASARVVARWKGAVVFGDDKIRAVLGAAIVVNSCHFGEVQSANARLFEVAGIGGFQISDAPGAADFFEPGVEIGTFKGPKEMRDVIAHYLARPEERASMAARSQRRAHAEHTYEKRLARLIDVVGLSDERASSGGGAA